MKKLLLFLSVYFSFYSIVNAQDIAPITFVNKDSVYDFGEIVKGDKPQYKFEIRNEGHAPLIIASIKSNNPGLKFEWPKKSLKHHKKMLIYMTYIPENPDEIGTFKSDIFITSNATSRPYPFIHVTGSVVPYRDPPKSPSPDNDHAVLYGPAPGLKTQ